jgi:hypothetical protein
VAEVSDLIPGVKDFRMQLIHKAKDEADWPFVAESGTLLCAKVFNKPAVYFVPKQVPEATRAFLLDTDLLGMSLVNIGMTNVLEPYGSLEALLTRITPFVTMGRRLCAQPPGTSLTGSEL